MNSEFYKTVGQGLLIWDELHKVILDMKVSMNNRPLCYLEEDVQLPLLVPNKTLFLNSNILPELLSTSERYMCVTVLNTMARSDPLQWEIMLLSCPLS